ncbi:MAG: cytochrome b [Bradyrhizobiaceae bacterium]|nr:MAG: cytochrome b [Bradyrhizobiaceae bacterium]
MLDDSKRTWGGVSRALHWILGVLIIGMIAYGWWMNHVPSRPDRFFYRSIHADIGYIILLLTALRLVWKLLNPTPALPAGTPLWLRAGARINQWSLYVMTFLVGILGWAHSGAHKPDYADFFGLFRVPQFTVENRQNAHDYEDWHIYMAYVLLALIALHIFGALYHRFIKRDGVLRRMIDGQPI